MTSTGDEMGRYIQALVALALSSCLASCDIFYGVMRTAELDEQLSLDCVRHVVETTSGINRVQFSESHEGKGLFHPTPWNYVYFFAGAPDSHVIGVLQIYKDYQGHFSYDDHLMDINRKPPQADIDATRPVMRAIEQNLAVQCGVAELPARVKEVCQGVACGPL
jgi:hypothetical protein